MVLKKELFYWRSKLFYKIEIFQDFQSEKELADYLKYLNDNTTAYAEYFEWKNYFNVSFNYNQPFCQVLIKSALL